MKMNFFRATFLFLALAGLVVSCSSPNDAVESEIHELENDFGPSGLDGEFGPSGLDG